MTYLLSAKGMTCIIHNSKTNDHFIIRGETVMELQKLADKELEKRGWQANDCWSEVLFF